MGAWPVVRVTVGTRASSPRTIAHLPPAQYHARGPYPVSTCILACSLSRIHAHPRVLRIDAPHEPAQNCARVLTRTRCKPSHTHTHTHTHTHIEQGRGSHPTIGTPTATEPGTCAARAPHVYRTCTARVCESRCELSIARAVAESGHPTRMPPNPPRARCRTVCFGYNDSDGACSMLLLLPTNR